MVYKRFLFLSVAFLTGCASYQTKVREAREHLADHRAEEATKLLEPLAREPGVDQLVYLFDYATALQVAGQYQLSNEIFHKADKESDAKDYFSVTKFGASLLGNEGLMPYRGDDYERLLINVMSALNYLMLEDYENAQVEIRHLNDKINYYRLEQKIEFEQNTAAMYLSALIWEAAKDWDNAYIDYERVYKRNPTLPYIREDLLRTAIRAGRSEAATKWAHEFNIKPNPLWKNKEYGEIILIFQQGWGPRKVERPRVATAYGFVSPGFPMLIPVESRIRSARLEISQAPEEGRNIAKTDISTEKSEPTQFIYSVQDAAIRALEDAYAPLIAKRIAAYIAKEAAARAVSKNDENVAALLSFAMHVMDTADLRQWSTLPESFQVARIYLPAGPYSITARGLLSTGEPSGEILPPRSITVKPQGKTFLSWRTFH